MFATTATQALAAKNRLDQKHMAPLAQMLNNCDAGIAIMVDVSSLLARSAKDTLADTHFQSAIDCLADPRLLKVSITDGLASFTNVAMVKNMQTISVVKESMTEAAEAVTMWSTIRYEELLSKLHAWVNDLRMALISIDVTRLLYVP